MQGMQGILGTEPARFLQPWDPGFGVLGNSQAVLQGESGCGHVMLQRTLSQGCVRTQSILTARPVGASCTETSAANLWQAAVSLHMRVWGCKRSENNFLN